MKITKEQLDKIMRRWMAYSWSIGLRDGDRAYIQAERAFLFGAFCEILDCTAGELMIEDVPPIVQLCWWSGRPVSSVGNWDVDANEQRLAASR